MDLVLSPTHENHTAPQTPKHISKGIVELTFYQLTSFLVDVIGELVKPSTLPITQTGWSPVYELHVCDDTADEVIEFKIEGCHLSLNLTPCVFDTAASHPTEGRSS